MGLCKSLFAPAHPVGVARRPSNRERCPVPLSNQRASQGFDAPMRRPRRRPGPWRPPRQNNSAPTAGVASKAAASAPAGKDLNNIDLFPHEKQMTTRFIFGIGAGGSWRH